MRFFLAIKVLLFTVLVPGAVTLFFPYRLLSNPYINWQSTHMALNIAALIFMLMGAAIYFRCAWDFAIQGLGTPAPIDPPKQLVIIGLYRRTRNPMYQGVILLLLAECLLFSDQGLLLYVGSIALTFHLFVVFYEEPALRSRFGKSYSDYCLQVPRWGYRFKNL